jgi:hypothetical protein
MNIQVFDSNGKLVDTLPANSRRGISRVDWPMNLKAPKVPPAATVAGEANQGPRVLPGSYSVRMLRGDQIYTTDLPIQMDPRAPYSLAERKLQFEAAMKAYNLLEEMSSDVENINATRNSLSDRASKLGEEDPLRKQLQSLADRSDDIRKKIVATKEGGAITGEERIREKTTQLYGDITNYEGRPTDYQVARIDSLKRELEDAMDEFKHSVAAALPNINQALEAKGLTQIEHWSEI